MGERDDQEGRSEPRPSELAFIEVDGLRRQRIQTVWKDVVDSGSAKGRRGEARAVLSCSFSRIRLREASAPKRFLTRAKQETKPILEDTINQANAKILKTFKEMVEKKIGDFKDFPEEKGGKNDDESGPALAKRQEMKSINGAASRRRFQYAAKGSSDDR